MQSSRRSTQQGEGPSSQRCRRRPLRCPGLQDAAMSGCRRRRSASSPLKLPPADIRRRFGGSTSGPHSFCRGSRERRRPDAPSCGRIRSSEAAAEPPATSRALLSRCSAMTSNQVSKVSSRRSAGLARTALQSVIGLTSRQEHSTHRLPRPLGRKPESPCPVLRICGSARRPARQAVCSNRKRRSRRDAERLRFDGRTS